MEKPIEETYQKKTQLEHILSRPDTYIGSVEHVSELLWIYDFKNKKMIQQTINYVPGLYKIFDEILVNAADNKQRDNNTNIIKVEIDKNNNIISVWNNGKGIPIVIHKDENMYVPTLIFGHLLTSSNYNDDEEKITGGRNGYGAKLCNIFSKKFTVETGCKSNKKYFKQSWYNNMHNSDNVVIKNYNGDDFTHITFIPDLSKFNMINLDDDIVNLMYKRIIDISGINNDVNVYINNILISIKTFKDYVNLYINNNENIICEKCNKYWEIAITKSDAGFQHISFVNSISTVKGGRHVDYICDMIIKHLAALVNKKNKSGMQIKSHQIKNHLWIFINCLIHNPSFDTQTKENMTLQVKNFKIECKLSDNFFKNISKLNIVESILSWINYKANMQLQKNTNKNTHKRLHNIVKLDDAFNAGTKNSINCSLILTEGDSAKSMAISGLASIGRENYGIFPLKGKVLNVRDAPINKVINNEEIKNIIKIIGLQYNKSYKTIKDIQSLRYGKIIIMTDQDQDGSHIKGLIINFIHTNWPDLLKINFIEEFITPIIKIQYKNTSLSFFSIPEFENWKSKNELKNSYKIKYYKGLGTSTSKEAKEYFENINRHNIKFVYSGPEDDQNIIMAFSKTCTNERKIWLTKYMKNKSQRYLYENNDSVTYTDFINLELVLYSYYDNVRSIPNVIDGLKPGQRKIIYTCLKRNDKKEIKVAQLSGSVAEQSAYHHGEISLMNTIINLAQNFVGSNNINLLLPIGQFGTRLCGGKDSASPRYIFTMLNSITKLIFNNLDNDLLLYEYDDQDKIEPTYYVPIIPMILVNGADGIGTGWMTKIPNYNPYDIIKSILLIMNNEEPQEIHPYYKNFKGIIEKQDNKYIFTGLYNIINTDIIEITELPIHTWTQKYKESVLENLIHNNIIKDYKEYHTDKIVHYIIIFDTNQLSKYTHDDIINLFKLQSTISLSSMCAFNHNLELINYNSVIDIIKEFYNIRLKFYEKRKNHMINILKKDLLKLKNQVRFISEKCSGKLIVENIKKEEMISNLINNNYDTIPENNNYDYLLNMPILSLTYEKKTHLENIYKNKIKTLTELKQILPIDMWKIDLQNLMIQLLDIEKQDEREEKLLNKNIKTPPKCFYASN